MAIIDFTVPGVAGNLRLEHTFSSRRLFQNGREVVRRGRKFKVTNDRGEPETLRIILNLPDFASTAVFRKQKTVLEPALATWQYLLGAVPMVLLFVGGAIGAVVGMLGSMLIFRFLRSGGSTTAQLLMSLLVWTACAVLYLTLTLILAWLIAPQ